MDKVYHFNFFQILSMLQYIVSIMGFYRCKTRCASIMGKKGEMGWRRKNEGKEMKT